LIFAALDLHLTLIAMPERVARYMSGWSNISLNGRALVFSIFLAVGAGVIAGLLPAIEALRFNLVDQLKSGSRGNTGSRRSRSLRNIFAVSQIALAVALVIGAALMSKGMGAMLHMADAFKPSKVLTFNVTLPAARYDTPRKQAAWYAASLEKLRALPSVAHAEATMALPYCDTGWLDGFEIENRATVPGKFQSALHISVSEGYFGAIHIPIVSGRVFNQSDSMDSQPVALVSRRFATQYFPGGDALGHRIRMGATRDSNARWLTIVGIVEETSYSLWDQAPIRRFIWTWHRCLLRAPPMR